MAQPEFKQVTLAEIRDTNLKIAENTAKVKLQEEAESIKKQQAALKAKEAAAKPAPKAKPETK